MINRELDNLKSNIGFGAAFKATFGFYAAKLVIGIIELSALLVIGLIAIYCFGRYA